MRALLMFPMALALAAGVTDAADLSLLAPLATSDVPPCSIRRGVRATRSSLIELNNLSASISSQAVREGTACSQSSALGVTVQNVSEEFELPDPAASTFAIQDIAANGSAILLTAWPKVQNSQGGLSIQMAVVPVSDGSIKWTAVSQLLQFPDCDVTFQPQGFLDPQHVLIAVVPGNAPHEKAGCTDKVLFYSLESDGHRIQPYDGPGLNRMAHPSSGALESCKTDPDLAGGCYTARARLAVDDDDEGMSLWPVGGAHYLSVEQELIPQALSAQVSRSMRIYATMMICPMVAEPPTSRARACIESASGFKADPITPKSGKAGGAVGTRNR